MIAVFLLVLIPVGMANLPPPPPAPSMGDTSSDSSDVAQYDDTSNSFNTYDDSGNDNSIDDSTTTQENTQQSTREVASPTSNNYSTYLLLGLIGFNIIMSLTTLALLVYVLFTKKKQRTVQETSEHIQPVANKVNLQLQQYVSQLTQQGYSYEQIYTYLKQYGYDDTTINNAFNYQQQ